MFRKSFIEVENMKLNLSFSKFRKYKSTVPGDIVITDEMEPPSITLIDYNKDHLNAQDSIKKIEGFSEIPNDMIRWIDIQGLGDKKILEDINHYFNDIHSSFFFYRPLRNEFC